MKTIHLVCPSPLAQLCAKDAVPKTRGRKYYFTPHVPNIQTLCAPYSTHSVCHSKTRAGNRASTVTAITSAAIDDQGARICRTPPTRALGGSPTRVRGRTNMKVDSDDEETTGRRTTESIYTASCAARRGKPRRLDRPGRHLSVRARGRSYLTI